MKLYFFTAADDHYKPETEILIESGRRYDREVHFYPIPDGKQWQPINDDHVLIHADGNVGGEKRLPYLRAIEKMRGGPQDG